MNQMVWELTVESWEWESGRLRESVHDIIQKIRDASASRLHPITAETLKKYNYRYIEPRDPLFSEKVDRYIHEHTEW